MVWGVRTMSVINMLSKETGLTKQAISKRLLKLADELGCKFSFQKSDKVRSIYAKRAKRIHKKRKKEVPSFNYKLLKLKETRKYACSKHSRELVRWLIKENKFQELKFHEEHNK